MEHKEKKASRMSVPQFGEWDQNAPGVDSGYTVVFTKARANKQHHKTDLSEVKRQSLGNDRGLVRKNTDTHKKYDHDHEKDEPSAATAMRRNKIPWFLTCCIRPR